jgi:2-polyprenyl-3-methyl-5-hydroxy-6-metoxy-1,4-benzoquinol methylase
MSLEIRARGAELMDELDADPELLEQSLHHLRGVNRFLGGRRGAVSLLQRMLRRHSPGHYRLLDVGTGSGDIPLALGRAARRRGYSMDLYGLDLHPRTAGVAHRRGGGALSVVVADALRLPVGDRGVDLALCATALHHFDDDQAVHVLRELDRVSRLGFVVTDLRRSRPALLGARLLAATVWRRNPVTRHDGPLSVRRAFTAAELSELARAAGLEGWRVRRDPVFRLSLTAERRA